MMPKILMPIFPRDPTSVLLRTELFSPSLHAQQFFTALFKQSFSFGIFVPFAVKQCLLSLPIRTTPAIYHLPNISRVIVCMLVIDYSQRTVRLVQASEQYVPHK